MVRLAARAVLRWSRAMRQGGVSKTDWLPGPGKEVSLLVTGSKGGRKKRERAEWPGTSGVALL